MVVNNRLEDLEGIIRLKRMCQLVPSVRIKEEQTSGGEQ